jgi:VanZ family protein
MQLKTTDDRDSFVRYTLPPILWAVLIFVSSSLPASAFPKVEFWGWAKLIHLIYYGVLCFLLDRLFIHQRRFALLSAHHMILAFVITVLYGATDEMHQILTPGRHSQFDDVAIDMLGASLFLLGAWIVRRFRLRDEVV